MKTTKKTGKSEAAKAKAEAPATQGEPKAEKKAKAVKGPKKPSLLDLAAEVLAKAGKPMGCKEMVEAVLAGGKWTTKGLTPHSTLYSTVIREIAEKKGDSRFKKVDRGQFAATAAKGA